MNVPVELAPTPSIGALTFTNGDPEAEPALLPIGALAFTNEPVPTEPVLSIGALTLTNGDPEAAPVLLPIGALAFTNEPVDTEPVLSIGALTLTNGDPEAEPALVPIAALAFSNEPVPAEPVLVIGAVTLTNGEAVAGRLLPGKPVLPPIGAVRFTNGEAVAGRLLPGKPVLPPAGAPAFTDGPVGAGPVLLIGTLTFTNSDPEAAPVVPTVPGLLLADELNVGELAVAGVVAAGTVMLVASVAGRGAVLGVWPVVRAGPANKAVGRLAETPEGATNGVHTAAAGTAGTAVGPPDSRVTNPEAVSAPAARADSETRVMKVFISYSLKLSVFSWSKHGGEAVLGSTRTD